MNPNYILYFKCTGRDQFTLTCKSLKEIPILTRKYCVEAGDCCAVECPSDANSAFSVTIRQPNGTYLVRISMESESMKTLKKWFEKEF